MAAPTLVYVNPALNSNSGSGTSGDPYGDLQWALDHVTRDSTNGNKFLIKSGTAEVLTGVISLTTYGTPTNSAPCIFEGYTAVENDGGLGTISANNSAAFQIFNAGRNFVYWQNLEFTNSAHASGALALGNNNYVKGCYFHDCTAGILIHAIGVACIVAGNRVEDVASGSYGIYISGSGCKCSQNYIKGATGNAASRGIRNDATSSAIIEFNTVVNCNGNGLLLAAVCAAHNNTVYTADAATGVGIETNAGATGPMDIVGNYVEGYSGSGGRGYLLASEMSAYGLNAAYNNATNVSMTGDSFRTPGANEVLSATGLAKVGANTYADRTTYYVPVNVGAMWNGALQNFDKGAWQHVAAQAIVTTRRQVR
jgi:hypothetical protein